LPNVAQPQVEGEVLFEIAINFRHFPLRALLTPLFMLAMRATLIMYFFSPGQSPFFGVVMGMWVLYEAWGAIRAAVAATRDPAEPRRDEDDQVQGGADRRAGFVGPIDPDILVATLPRNYLRNFIPNMLATINIGNENQVLFSRGNLQPPPPTFFHTAKTFVSLMFVTLVPALWDRRREELRRREGELRTEMNVITAAQAAPSLSGSAAPASNPPTEGEDESEIAIQEREELRKAKEKKLAIIQKHARRPDWVREYVERAGRMEHYDD